MVLESTFGDQFGILQSGFCFVCEIETGNSLPENPFSGRVSTSLTMKQMDTSEPIWPLNNNATKRIDPAKNVITQNHTRKDAFRLPLDGFLKKKLETCGCNKTIDFFLFVLFFWGGGVVAMNVVVVFCVCCSRFCLVVVKTLSCSKRKNAHKYHFLHLCPQCVFTQKKECKPQTLTFRRDRGSNCCNSTQVTCLASCNC